jgi:hypothetical protein
VTLGACHGREGRKALVVIIVGGGGLYRRQFGRRHVGELEQRWIVALGIRRRRVRGHMLAGTVGVSVSMSVGLVEGSELVVFQVVGPGAHVILLHGLLVEGETGGVSAKQRQ